MSHVNVSSQHTAVSSKGGRLPLFLLSAYCLVLSAPMAQAAEMKKTAVKPAQAKTATPEAEAKTERRIVEGKVVSVSKRSISVEYEEKKQMQEMLLPLGADLKLEGVASLLELKRGDRVKVGVEQTYRGVPDGEPALLKTEALVIVLVQPAAAAAGAPGATPVK